MPAGHIDTSPDRTAGDSIVLGIHHYQLREGVEAATFESFLNEGYMPIMRNLMPGIKMMFMRAERNGEPGQYVLVVNVPSLSVRDHYWPESGVSSDAAQAIMDECAEACARAEEKLNSMVEHTGSWADWVEVAR
jgi:hypothetical protein